jgi:hypothetical protein
MANGILRFWHTIKHLKPSQFLYRLRRLQRNHLLGPSDYPRPEEADFGESIAPKLPLEASASAVDGARALLGEGLRFVGRPPRPLEQIDWHRGPDDDLLWLFNLHYFRWAIPLARGWRASQNAAFAHEARRWMLDWVHENPFPNSDGWHPYPTSRRLVNWAILLDATSDAPDTAASTPTLLSSIDQQARFLADWPERELEGNHLLANYHALAWVYLHLGEHLRPETRASLRPYVDEFWEEFGRQIRTDGSHEENSASYHMVVCKDALQLAILARRVGKPASAACHMVLEKGLDWLAGVLVPEGDAFRAPLVNDSVRGYPCMASSLMKLGSAYFGRGDLKYLAGSDDIDDLRWWLGSSELDAYAQLEPHEPRELGAVFEASGYAVMRGGWRADSDYMLFDGGPIGPDHIPGHAHADTLSVIIASAGELRLVDPGVYTYRQGPWRDHFRSTMAHNTVTVDGENQSEIWSAFRVARRANATIERWTENRSIAASHDGYRRLAHPVTHEREATYLGPGRWRLVDRLESDGEQHRYTITFQFSTSAMAVNCTRDSAEVTFSDGLTARLEFESGSPIELTSTTGQVSESWGELDEAPCLRVDLDTDARLATTTTIITID